MGGERELVELFVRAGSRTLKGEPVRVQAADTGRRARSLNVTKGLKGSDDESAFYAPFVRTKKQPEEWGLIC